VHPDLQKLGLLEFVERRRKAGHAVLFPDLKLDRRGYLSDAYQKWFARHLRNIGATAPRTSFHSTRHCFRDALREIAAPRDVVLALGGWAGNGGTEDTYGSGLRIKTLALWIKKIDYGMHDMTLVEVTALLLAAEFQFAKTMPKTPHHYTLRETWEDGSVFEAVVQFIRDHGKEEKFFRATYIYLYLEGHKYWTMGSPLDQTRLINRADENLQYD
jgi:hypothetical protein